MQSAAAQQAAIPERMAGSGLYPSLYGQSSLSASGLQASSHRAPPTEADSDDDASRIGIGMFD